MDIRVLKYFLEVVNQGNITRAAEVLHITQPTLSRQLMDLEEEVGATLFVRGKRKIHLTDAGFLYQKRVKEMLRIMEKAEKELVCKAGELTGVLSIGCVESQAANFLMDQVEIFHKKYPLVQYEFYNAFSDDIKSKLDSDELDIGILIEPVEAAKYDYHRLPIEEKWGILVSKEHKLANEEYITVDQIVGEPLTLTSRNIVINDFEAMIGADKDSLNVVVTRNLLTNTLPLVKKGMIIEIIIEGALTIRNDVDVRFIPFKPLKVSNHVLAWKKTRERSKLTKLFVDQLLTEIVEMTEE